MSMMIDPYRFAGGGTLIPANPDYYRMALLADATGQANGTGYTTEESRFGHTLTYNGDAAVASEKFEFDGTGDYIDLPTSILWTPGHKFTLEVFGLEFDAVNTGTQQQILSQDRSSDNSWALYEAGGTLTLGWSTTGGLTTDTLSLGSVSSATSYDIAICWDGATVYAFKNGALVGSVSFTSFFHDASVALRFGARAYSTADLFLNGRFACVMLTRGETLYASAGEHTIPSLPRSVDTPSLTDTAWADVVLLATYNSTLSRFVDEGPLDLPFSVIGGDVAGSTGVQPFSGVNSIAFDGSGDYLAIFDDALLELGASDFTLEAMVRHNTAGLGDPQRYIAKYNSISSDRSYAFGYRGDVAGDPLTMTRSSNGSGTTTTINNNWGPSGDTWYHAAYTRTSNTGRHFADGSQVGTDQTDSITYFNGDSLQYIGRYEGGADDHYMNGYLAEIRITIGTARYTGSYTTPSAAFPRG